MAELEKQAEKLLACSVEQYGELLQHTEKLVKIIGDNDYDRIEKHATRLQKMQDVARRHDKELLPLLMANLESWKENTLFQKRLGCIRSIVKINELLLPEINGAMAVTASELEKLNGGRTALAGYASQKIAKRGTLGVG